MDIALEELKKERRLAASRLAEIDRAIIELSPNVERYINLRDFMSEKHDFTWLIGGFLARGTMSMLVADAGTGKSTLMAQLTLSLVHGKPFLGGRIEKPARVLLLAAEGARAAFQGRIRTAIRALGYADTPAFDSWLIHAQNFSDYRIDGGLGVMVREAKPDLVILDTIGYFATYDENKASEWKASIAVPLRALANETDTAFILVHHPPKMTEANKDYRDGRGTSAMKDDCDHFWRLDAVKGEPMQRTLVTVKNKYGAAWDMDLSFDAENAIFRLVNAAASPKAVPPPPPPKPKEPVRQISFTESRTEQEE